ncbi:hypothetical protein EDD36DRAFT_325802 [Exophiala viscosa]|uniref:Uncharacterized protein n=1 Tax=Exophiala viscosa TaxID=2486360 RepID=A0AAN6DSC5_9EURO|nr:hypothetical protein EDD36DRAFT_325802 [Exophiala viscosa]
MRLITAIATFLLALTVAASGSWSSEEWGTTTITLTSSMSKTLTITRTLAFANATTSSSTYSSQYTGWNATATTINKATLTPASASYYSASPSIASVTATGAGSVQEVNLAVAALAGAAAMFWASS